MQLSIPLIQLKNIEKVFLTDEIETHALFGVSLEICRGDYVSISGPSGCAGVVERILTLPGAAVKPDTVLVELSNPELEQDAFEAESQLKADLAHLKVQLASQKLTQQAAVATAQANYTTAKADSEVNVHNGMEVLG